VIYTTKSKLPLTTARIPQESVSFHKEIKKGQFDFRASTG
jgi:hypothetical protein